MSRLPVPAARPVDVPGDHVSILDCWVETEPDRDTVRYLMYRLRLTLETGEAFEFVKAIRMLRVLRVPYQLRELRTLMDIHHDVLTGLWSSGVNFLSLVANILQPQPLGLIHCYGVQASGDRPEEARVAADAQYAALVAALQGSYRQLHFGPLDKDEADQLLRLMARLPKVLALRGIPQARKAAAQSTESAISGGPANPAMEEQVEEFVRGMIGHEFLFLVLCSPVATSDLDRWLHQVSKEESRWASQREGTKSVSAGLSMPMMLLGNVGTVQGLSRGIGHTDTEARSVAHTEGHSVTDTVGHSESVSRSHAVGESEQLGWQRSVGHSQGISEAIQHSRSQTLSESQTVTHSESVSHARSVGETHAVSTGVTESAQHTRSTSRSEAESVQVSEGQAHTRGVAESTVHTEGEAASVQRGVAQSRQHAVAHGEQTGVTAGTSRAVGRTQGDSAGVSVDGGAVVIRGGGNWSRSASQSVTETGSYSQSYGRSQQVTDTVGEQYSLSTGETHSRSVSRGVQQSESVTRSEQVSHGRSVGITEGESVSRGVARSQSETHGVSVQETVAVTQGRSVGHTVGRSTSEGVAVTQGRNAQVSESQGVSASRGLSVVESLGVSRAVSQSRSVGHSIAETVGLSRGQAESVTLGRSLSESQALSGGLTLGPFLSLSKSFRWVDIPADNLAKLLEEQRRRLWLSLQGQGAHFVDAYVLVADEPARQAAAAAAKAAWYGDVLPTPFEAMLLSEEEQAHLLLHAQALSPCYARESIQGILEGYRYTTILLGEELAALTHPLRLEVGGPASVAEDVPELRVPARMTGEIYHGRIVSGAVWTPGSGHVTPYAYRIPKEHLGHALFVGQSRSGKTVGALRFVAEVANNVSYGLDEQGRPRRLSVVALDWKSDWRVLKRVVEPERFYFYDMARPDVSPLRMNLIRIPQGVDPAFWVDLVAEAFSLAYGLGTRGYSIIWQHLTELYRQHNVFQYPERSQRVTLHDLWQSVHNTKLDMDSPNPKGGRVGNDVRDRYQAVLDRLVYYEQGRWRDLYCYTGPDAVTVEDLCRQDGRVTVLEGSLMPRVQKTFVIGLLAAAIWAYCQARQGFDPGLLVVFEEAHEVVRGADPQQGNLININETVYETMYAEAMGLRLYLCTITQMPSRLPPSVIANCPLLYAYRMEVEQDIHTMVRKIGRDYRYDHRELARWFTRQPTGWCVARSARVGSWLDAEPVIVATDPLALTRPSDEELAAFMRARLNGL